LLKAGIWGTGTGGSGNQDIKGIKYMGDIKDSEGIKRQDGVEAVGELW
jgi:hypothetical protein